MLDSPGLVSVLSTDQTRTPSCFQAARQCSGARRLSLLSASSFGEIKYNTTKMAFMAMRKNLDERARKKELDAIFAKFDHNHNGIAAITRSLTE